MASKKPAKPIAGAGKEKEKVLPGKAVMYMIAMKGHGLFECPTCNRNLAKGIVYEHNNVMYCKRGCIPQDLTQSN